MAQKLESLEAKLCDVEEVIHQFRLGQTVVVVVDFNGERIEYNRTSLRTLIPYAEELKLEIAKCGGAPYSPRHKAIVLKRC